MSTYFTADTHFGHARIIEYCKRPYKDMNHMNEELIARWNSKVKHDDTVYHLGDFGFGPTMPFIRRRLNGKIRLILGNHDKITLENANLFESIKSLELIGIGNGQRVVLCHYAMRVWQMQGHGSWQLYGHSHGNLADDPAIRSLDVGVDCWDYYPVSIPQIEAKMALKTSKTPDHHGPKDLSD